MRVILPMSPLPCRNPTFWQHPDLLTSHLTKLTGDSTALCSTQVALVKTTVDEIEK